LKRGPGGPEEEIQTLVADVVKVLRKPGPGVGTAKFFHKKGGGEGIFPCNPRFPKAQSAYAQTSKMAYKHVAKTRRAMGQEIGQLELKG